MAFNCVHNRFRAQGLEPVAWRTARQDDRGDTLCGVSCVWLAFLCVSVRLWIRAMRGFAYIHSFARLLTRSNCKYGQFVSSCARFHASYAPIINIIASKHNICMFELYKACCNS